MAYHMQHYEEVFALDEYERALIRATYGLPLFNIANSRWLAEMFSIVWDKKLPIVNPGIDTNLFCCDKLSVKSKYDRVPCIKIVSYADDRPMKGWEDTVKIMKSVFENVGNQGHIEWITFGAGKANTDGLPVTHLGKISPSKLAQVYRTAHIVMMPSWYESFPLPPIEAMACGSAVVCTRFGTEDYAIHRTNALVSQPRAINELAGFVSELIHSRDLMLDLALHGLDTAQEFTWDAATNRLESVLHRAIDLGHTVQTATKSLGNFVSGQADAFPDINKICWWNNDNIAEAWSR
jgi:glycosyltransferase involved in cell wall biosynthesis